MAAKYRVAVIGHTGRGNYGHGLDVVWRDIPDVELVGVADADPKGLEQAAARLKAPKAYADYRKMLGELKPQLVAVAPRWLDQHRDMALAAIEAGALGIYLEKPMCRDLVEADEIIEAADAKKVKIAISHQTRYSPKLPVIWELLNSGKLGTLLEIRCRGKEDSRGGAEDLWVLGTHVLNMATHFGGHPQSCNAQVFSQGKPIAAADVRDGGEGIGPLAGDEVHATYRLARGPIATFDSVRGMAGRPSRFGFQLVGSKGIVQMGVNYLPPAYWLDDSSWSPGQSGKKWLPITSAGIDVPEPLADGQLHAGNVLAVKDLISAIEADRQPESNAYEGRVAVEMILAAFESQRVGRPVTFPLATRVSPVKLLKDKS